jgi:hypothetical protein
MKLLGSFKQGISFRAEKLRVLAYQRRSDFMELKLQRRFFYTDKNMGTSDFNLQLVSPVSLHSFISIRIRKVEINLIAENKIRHVPFFHWLHCPA